MNYPKDYFQPTTCPIHGTDVFPAISRKTGYRYYQCNANFGKVVDGKIIAPHFVDDPDKHHANSAGYDSNFINEQPRHE